MRVAIALVVAASLAAVAHASDDPAVKASRPVEPAWEKFYQQRLDAVVNAKTWSVGSGEGDPDVGKRDWPGLLAEMYKVRNDPAAIKAAIAGKGRTLVYSKNAGTFFKPFANPGYASYYFQFKDQLPAEQKAQARKMIASVGWDQMMRPDGKMDPIYASTEFNSENFNWMARLTGFLFAREFGDVEKSRYFSGYVDNWTRAMFNAGRVEWDSNNYWGYCFQPVLVLHAHAPDEKSRLQAQAVADWMVLTMALHYTDGFLVGPDVRAKGGAYQKFAGSAWMYGWLYFADAEGNFPSFGAGEVRAHPDQNLAGFAAWAKYRPAQVAIDIARRNFKTPVEMHNAKPFYGLDENNYAAWQGSTQRSRRFEFETLYIDKDFTLGSLATYRPDGRVGTFSEQSVWRLGVRQSSGGCEQVFGNSGEMKGLAGRWPQEEIGQSRNVMIRVARQTDNMWVALPSQRKVEFAGEVGFVDLGSDVYAAITPVNATGRKEEPFVEGKSTASTHTRHTWTFDPAKLAGLVMEVGTKREFGNLATFKQKVLFNKPAADGNTIKHTGTQGGAMEITWQPPAKYTLHDGKVVDPAGVPPRLVADGQVVDYGTWDSYEVVRGEKILEQKWGSGRMTAQAAGRTLEITVDPKTAAVTYVAK